MWEKGTIDNPTAGQLKKLAMLLQESSGLPVRPKSGAEPEVDFADPRRPILVCDAGIVTAAVDLNIAYFDHRAGVMMARPLSKESSGDDIAATEGASASERD